MGPGEFAVHYSNFEGEAGKAPYCTVFGSMEDAVAYAQRKVADRPTLWCRIYDDQGLIGPGLKEIRGAEYREKGEMTARFRRWAVVILLLGGLILIGIDWNSDFRYTWPATIGMRMVIPGLVLAVTEVVIVVLDRRRRGKEAA